MRGILLLVALALLVVAAPASAGERLFALTDAVPPHVVSFDAGAPGTFSTDTPVTGLGAGETVIGLDTRPVAGAGPRLYALTRDGAGTGRLYTIDPATGGATFVATLTADPTDMTSPYTSLPGGAAYGIDFNPVADRLRVVDSAGDNLRVHPVTGAVITDGGIPAPAVVAAVAYSNSVPGATVTTLYAYDSQSDSLDTLNPPNTGTLNTVGPSGIATSGPAGSSLEIAPSGLAYASQTVGGVPSLFSVDLTTGTHTLLGALPAATLGLTASPANLVVVTAPTQRVSEQDQSVTVTVARENPRGTLSLNWTTGGGTATAGEDYTAASGTVTMADGQAVKTVTITLLGDTVVEPDETFDVTFAFNGSQEGTLLAPRQTITIADDDVPAAAVPDRDADGVPDASDNCPNVVNADQADGNGNGVGKACDLSEVPAPPPPNTTPATITPPTVPAPKPGRCANAQKGTAKDDGLVGTAAGDLLNGLAGADALFGGAGDDCLTGDAGDDWLSGGDGNDDLKGGAGNDLIYGGNGNDAIDGGTGVNVIKAGAGNDTIKAKNKKRETIDCGAGKDKVTADKTDKLKGCETKS